MNERREVTGSSGAAGGGDHAFLRRDGEMLDLGVPEGYVESQGWYVTARGEVVGRVTRAGDGGWDAFVRAVR